MLNKVWENSSGQMVALQLQMLWTFGKYLPVLPKVCGSAINLDVDRSPESELSLINTDISLFAVKISFIN